MGDDDLVDWDDLSAADRIKIMGTVAQDTAAKAWHNGPRQWRKGISITVILTDITKPERVAIGSAHAPDDYGTASRILARALRVAADKLDPLS